MIKLTPLINELGINMYIPGIILDDNNDIRITINNIVYNWIVDDGDYRKSYSNDDIIKISIDEPSDEIGNEEYEMFDENCELFLKVFKGNKIKPRYYGLIEGALEGIDCFIKINRLRGYSTFINKWNKYTRVEPGILYKIDNSSGNLIQVQHYSNYPDMNKHYDMIQINKDNPVIYAILKSYYKGKYYFGTSNYFKTSDLPEHCFIEINENQLNLINKV